MSACTPTLLFLPGAAGDPAFWQPVVHDMAELAPAYPCLVQGYPGFAGHPAVPGVRDFASLCDWVLAQITQPVVMVAQSMGGILAMQAALHKPDLVRGLVLVATSGGLDVSAFGAADWRDDYALKMAHLPQWFVQATCATCDMSPHLARLRLPVSLIWGGADPISPPAVGRFLQRALPHASLAVIANGGHDVAHAHARQTADLIRAYLARLRAADGLKGAVHEPCF